MNNNDLLTNPMYSHLPQNIHYNEWIDNEMTKKCLDNKKTRSNANHKNNFIRFLIVLAVLFGIAYAGLCFYLWNTY